MPMRREYGFRMKLHALDSHFPVAQAHDFVNLPSLGLCPGGNLEAVRQAFPLHYQAVVTGRLKGSAEIAKDTLSAVKNRRGFTVHYVARTYHLAAEHLPNALVTQANAEQRHDTGVLADHVHGDA